MKNKKKNKSIIFIEDTSESTDKKNKKSQHQTSININSSINSSINTSTNSNSNSDNESYSSSDSNDFYMKRRSNIENKFDDNGEYIRPRFEKNIYESDEEIIYVDDEGSYIKKFRWNQYYKENENLLENIGSNFDVHSILADSIKTNIKNSSNNVNDKNIKNLNTTNMSNTSNTIISDELIEDTNQKNEIIDSHTSLHLQLKRIQHFLNSVKKS
jgi:hypothetical protein